MENVIYICRALLLFTAGDGTKSMGRLSQREEGRHPGVEDDDSQFVALCRDGKPEAFEVLVRRHQKRMFNIAYRMTGNYEDASDVVQEAFLSAYRTIKDFRGDAKFATWLYGIVVNHSRNRSRASSTRTYHEPVSLDDPPAGGDGLRLEVPSGETSAVDLLVRKETQEKVQGCIGELESEHREILVLRDIQGFSYEEISTMLGLAEGTVKSRISRARNALKQGLTRVFGDL